MSNKLKNIIESISSSLSTITNPKADLKKIAQLLNTTPDAIREFENAYHKADFAKGMSENLFQVNSRQIVEYTKNDATFPTDVSDMIERIVTELIAQTQVFSYEPDKKNTFLYDYTNALPNHENNVTLDEINTLPANLRPELTGNLMKTDIPGSPTGIVLLDMLRKSLDAKNEKTAKGFYNRFRQGMDLLDIDNITYEMIDRNQNSMGNWLPFITKSVDDEGFFKIPATKIVKIPTTMLQLTREDYMSMTETTKEIVNEYCRKVFELDENKDYFIKTGTYSSKFDFRNAHVSDPAEIREIGLYLLFIHWQALQMSHYDLSGRNQPVIYGVSTTTEWVVREFIPDKEDNLTIYHGLPLRTEYRAFVDFDTDTVLGIHNYWDSNVMIPHFEKRMMADANDIDAKHDYITYTANMDRLTERYEHNVDTVRQHLNAILPDIHMHGQWSVDIMQNGDDFYIIDMAVAENSAFYKETVPVSLRHVSEENWLPVINN